MNAEELKQARESFNHAIFGISHCGCNDCEKEKAKLMRIPKALNELEKLRVENKKMREINAGLMLAFETAQKTENALKEQRKRHIQAGLIQAKELAKLEIENKQLRDEKDLPKELKDREEK